MLQRLQAVVKFILSSRGKEQLPALNEKISSASIVSAGTGF